MLENLDLSKRRFLIWMIVAAVVVIVDQVTKAAIVNHLPDLYQTDPVNSFITLTHQRNYGAAWSFLADAGGWQRWFFVILAFVVSGVLGVWLWQIRNNGPIVLAAGLALVLGGAVGNLIDRLFLGYVIDFIQVRFRGVPFFDPFPSFNVADSAITVGAALLIIDAIFHGERKTGEKAG